MLNLLLWTAQQILPANNLIRDVPKNILRKEKKKRWKLQIFSGMTSWEFPVLQAGCCLIESIPLQVTSSCSVYTRVHTVPLWSEQSNFRAGHHLEIKFPARVMWVHLYNILQSICQENSIFPCTIIFANSKLGIAHMYVLSNPESRGTSNLNQLQVLCLNSTCLAEHYHWTMV